MAWLFLIVTGVLTLVVLALAVQTVRLRGRIDGLEHRLAAPSPSSDPQRSSQAAPDDHVGSLDEPRPTTQGSEYVITHIGEPEPEPAPTVSAPVFADIVLRETVVQTASLFHGLRRALSPETRHRIRFQMRQEVKRSRKQRRADLKAALRDLQERDRAGRAGEDAA